MFDLRSFSIRLIVFELHLLLGFLTLFPQNFSVTVWMSLFILVERLSISTSDGFSIGSSFFVFSIFSAVVNLSLWNNFFLSNFLLILKKVLTNRWSLFTLSLEGVFKRRQWQLKGLKLHNLFFSHLR